MPKTMPRETLQQVESCSSLGQSLKIHGNGGSRLPCELEVSGGIHGRWRPTTQEGGWWRCDAASSWLWCHATRRRRCSGTRDEVAVCGMMVWSSALRRRRPRKIAAGIRIEDLGVRQGVRAMRTMLASHRLVACKVTCRRRRVRRRAWRDAHCRVKLQC